MEFETSQGAIHVDIEHAVVAGWTGRDAVAVNHHIAELADIGVAAPSQVPLFYRIASPMLTLADKIQVLGSASSGEAEPLLINSNNEIWLGLASDHTDRNMEIYSVAYSKQICQKPVAGKLWKLSEVSDHLDKILLRSWVYEKSQWQLYQQGLLNKILPLEALLKEAELDDNGALFCGTLPVIGGIRSTDQFRMALIDPVLKREIQSSYRIDKLPVIT